MSGNPRDRLVLPGACRAGTEHALYGLLHKYSFRLFLRDIINEKGPFRPADVGKYASPDVVRRYIRELISLGVLKKAGTRFALTSSRIYSFGDTFEWYVSSIFTREFLCPAEWGVKLKEVQSGGDMDVAALVDGRFVYVEVKSSPPKHIEQHEIAAFLDRVIELRPDAAIFLEDTRLRMKDKIVPMFEDELRARWQRRAPAVERMKAELFRVGNRLFISNSKPDVASNLGRCLGQVLSRPVLPSFLSA